MTILHSVEDPRGPFEKLTRKQLEYVFKNEGLYYEPGQPKTISIQVLSSKGIDGYKYLNLARTGALNGNLGRQEAVVPKIEKSPETMKMSELRTYCKNKGLTVSRKATKIQLLEALKRVPTFS